MGMGEGVPRAIRPGTLGHADYLGDFVGQAARYMDISAHGGQVVCEEAVAIAALNMLQQVRSCEGGEGARMWRLMSDLLYMCSALGTVL